MKRDAFSASSRPRVDGDPGRCAGSKHVDRRRRSRRRRDLAAAALPSRSHGESARRHAATFRRRSAHGAQRDVRVAVSDPRLDRTVVRGRRRARRAKRRSGRRRKASFFLRGGVATLLGLPNAAVRVKYVEGSGCYGHNGSDDAAADAALLSQAVGAPVRVQWMRDHEHGWDPKGPAMVVAHSAALDAPGQRIAAWHIRRLVAHALDAPAGQRRQLCWPAG